MKLLKAPGAELGQSVGACNGTAAIIIGRRGVSFVTKKKNKHKSDSPMNADTDGNETRSSGREFRHLCYMKSPQTRVKRVF